ncbi:MAG: hypothetical protein AAFX09_06685 [Pseudomonadota bacterium]
MSESPRHLSLDIERARAALSRARSDGADAVRSPRPADLRHLQDDMERRGAMEARISAFRHKVHADLGIGDYAGPFSSVDMPGARQSGLAICDAEICAPAAPPAPSHTALSGGVMERTAPPAPEAPPMAASAPLAGETEGLALQDAPAEDDEETIAPPAANEAVQDARAWREAPPQKKRRKFLGIF